ncbi:MAG TPA: cytochrome P450 [Woeseiaceae bacterium]|nr:cytochrome P450 [Woeseiaceae bacterium]
MIDSRSAVRRPPGPSDQVHLGIDPQTLVTLTQVRDAYGDIVSMRRQNGRLAYFINDPAEVRRILTRRHSRYVKGPGFERVKMLLGNGLIVSDGDAWRRSRTMIQPAFSRQNVHRLIDVMVQCCDNRAVRWAAAAEQGKPVNITAETSDFALELILISIFGDDYETKLLAQGENPFAFLASDSTRDLGVVMKARNLRRLLLDIIAARRDAGNVETCDFLSMYMHATDKQGAAFSDDELLDELITLIVAGFETSANTLNWVWYLLAGDVGVESKVIEESRRLVPTVSAVSADSLAGMQYTQQVLEETLRLYPPVWLFTRRSCEDDELDAFDVPGDTDIYLSPFILHRTAAFWPEPERFDPDRFAEGRLPKIERPYFPFSLGPRRCLGEYFSFLEMKVHLGLLLPRFRMMRVDDEDPGLELAVNLRSASDIWLQPAIRTA